MSAQYEYKLDSNDFSAGTTSTSSASFTPSSDLPLGAHTLYVRQRVAGSYWSALASAQTRVTIAAPLVSGGDANVAISNNTRPTAYAKPEWRWLAISVFGMNKDKKSKPLPQTKLRPVGKKSKSCPPFRWQQEQPTHFPFQSSTFILRCRPQIGLLLSLLISTSQV